MRVLHLDLGLTLRGGQRQVYYLVRAMHQQARVPAQVPCVAGQVPCVAGQVPRVAGPNSPQAGFIPGNAAFTPLTACPAHSALAHLLRDQGLPVLPLPGRSLANPLVLWAIERAIRNFVPAVLHTHDAHAATLGGLCKRLHPGLVLVHSRRVSYAPHQGLRLRKYLLADAVVGVSRDISAQLVQAGLPAFKVHTIHSGIDPTCYAPWQPHEGPFTFGSVGALTPQKGYSVLLEAMACLQNTEQSTPLPPWQVRLVGDGLLFEKLQNQAQALGIEHRLHMPGRQDSRDVLPLFDAMVVPSVDGEGSSATIKEGWATGIPVLCSALTSNLELVTHETDGLTAQPGNAKALAEIMKRCLTDNALRERLVQTGKSTLEGFTDQRMAASYMALYTRLLP